MEERKWTKVESAVKGSNAANPLAIVDDDIVDLTDVTPLSRRRDSTFTLISLKGNPSPMSRLRQKNAQATIDLTSDCEEQSADTQPVSKDANRVVDLSTPVSKTQAHEYNSDGEDSSDSDCHREAMLEVLHSHASTVVNRTSGRLAIAESKTRAASVLKMEESAWPKTHTSTTGRRENLRLQKLERVGFPRRQHLNLPRSTCHANSDPVAEKLPASQHISSRNMMARPGNLGMSQQPSPPTMASKGSSQSLEISESMKSFGRQFSTNRLRSDGPNAQLNPGPARVNSGFSDVPFGFPNGSHQNSQNQPSTHAQAQSFMAAAASTIQSGHNSGFQQLSPFAGPMLSQEAFMSFDQLFASITASMQHQNLGLQPGQEIENITPPTTANREARLKLIQAQATKAALVSLQEGLVRVFGFSVNGFSNIQINNAKKLGRITQSLDLTLPTQDIITSISGEEPTVINQLAVACAGVVRTRQQMDSTGDQRLAETLQAWKIEKLFWSARLRAIQNSIFDFQAFVEWEAEVQIPSGAPPAHSRPG
ncbi:hypothetical protein DL95DRAFT_470023 [Leptodontidium sp. 2 PMI_412]|nr:hypothetical protein DL95DRAFT_470023 [Leptodontidium sp. 2 PMI_412]